MEAVRWREEARDGRARAGWLDTPSGTVPTPAFMVVGTAASVKGMTPRQLRDAGAGILLANTYHLAVRPGAETVAGQGGLARFMGWDGPTLTDSGGYQVYSLAERRELGVDGVRFRNHVDGRELFLSPETSVEIQQTLGADILMCLDECPPGSADRETMRKSLDLTHAWAARSKSAWTRREHHALFGIVQGGRYDDLRAESTGVLAEMDFPGYAIGGVSVGEPPEEIARVVSVTAPLLPESKPRYLMGVGRPQDLLRAVGAGIDMFDCVMPTRNARHGQAFTSEGVLNLKNARHRDDGGPLEDGCDCEACRTVGRAYIRHLLLAREVMGAVWLTLHNVRFYLRLMGEMRRAIVEGRFAAFVAERLTRMEGIRCPHG